MKYKIALGMLAVVVMGALLVAIALVHGKLQSLEAQRIKEAPCKALRETTGKPYEYFEAMLLTPGIFHPPCPMGNCTGALAQLSAWQLIYENTRLGRFSAGFNGPYDKMLTYSKLLSVAPIKHKFCAFKNIIPGDLITYNMDVKTLEVEANDANK